ncbi:MAG: alpha/beta fold hydrolase [Deltaproteobacteria bacterium]|nr:alpha/beta fold hydrolase [Deltaproteobacteria bacterium]
MERGTNGRETWSSIAVLAAALALAAGSPACRRTERLPTRNEELEPVAGGGAARTGADATFDEDAAEAPPGLRAAGRGEPRRVTLATADGVTLVGDWFPSPLGAAAPTLLLLHGADGRRSDWQPLVDRLLASPGARASVLAIDLRGHGESTATSTGTVAARKLSDDPRAGVASWSGVVADAAAALAWIRAQPDVGPKLVVVGTDLGTVAGARAAAQNPAGDGGIADVVGLVGLSPAVLHGVEWGAETFATLAARGVQGFAVAAEDGGAEPPQGVLAIEGGLGVPRTDCEVFRDGGHGLELVQRQAGLEGRLLGFLRKLLGATAEFAIPMPDGTSLRATADLSLDAGGPVVLLVHEVGRSRATLKRLREVLVERTPYDLVAFDLRSRPAAANAEADAGSAPEEAGDGGASVGGASGPGATFIDGVPVEDPRSWWQLVRDVEAVVRAVLAGGGVPSVDGGTPVPRSAWALVGLGFGGTLAVAAAGELAGDAALPPLAAVALVSPVANAHGITLWEPLGNRLRPTGVSVFAAAGARTAMSAHDMADGLGSQAKAVRSVGAMFRDRATIRTYTSEAHAEQLIHAHVDLGPAMAEFLYARVEEALRKGLVRVTGPVPLVGGPPPPPWVGAEPSKDGEPDAELSVGGAITPDKMRVPPGLLPNQRIPLDSLRGPRLRTAPPQLRP